MANNATSSINFYANGRCMTGQYSETVVPNVYRTDMEGGFAKQAKRSSKQIIQREVTYLYSSSEFEGFKDWHQNTAKDGALMFNWVDPVSSNTIDARIVSGEYSATPVNARMSHFYVTMTLETYR